MTCSIRKLTPVALALIAFGAGWLAKTAAQTKSAVPFVTYFSHEKVDASFAKAAATDGSRILYARKDKQGVEYSIHSNTRDKGGEGELHSHEGWTAVVMIVSGGATFITPGKPSGPAPKAPADALGGQLIGSGESHHIQKGDVVIVPPGVPHIYKDIQEPFRYLVVQTPL